MAKTPPDLPDAAALRALVERGGADGDGRLALRVTPGARVESLAIENGRVSAKVRAKPQDGEATAAVIALLARALDMAPTRITLLRGATSREKLFRIG